MPQPFVPGPDSGVVMFNVSDMVTNRPALALELADTITLWAYTEAQIGNVLSTILQGDAEKIIETYINQRSASKQRAILVEHANERLEGAALEALHAAVAILVSDQRRRNQLVHGLWGYATGKPTIALLLDPKDAWRGRAAEARFTHQVNARATAHIENWPDDPPPMPSFPQSKARFQAYTASDFRQMRRDFEETGEMFRSIDFYIRFLWNEEESARMLDQLHSSPRFQQALSRLRSHLQNPPAEHRE